MTEDILLTCPYCGKEDLSCRPEEEYEIFIEVPHKKNKSRFFGNPKPKREKREMSYPYEIKCLPYTRDVGRFDPDPEEEEPNKKLKYWKRTGKDFLKWLNFEKIGILRKSQKTLRIYYRVAKCIRCNKLFDVFLNYPPDERSPATPLGQIWPHLFKTLDNSEEIIKYQGVSFILSIVQNLAQKVKSSNLAITIICLSLFLLAIFPWFISLIVESNSKFLVPFKPQMVILYFIAALGVTILIIFENRYLSYMEKTRDFYDLLDVRKAEIGVTFWRNYTLCRFVGVQGMDKQRPSLSQVDFVAGGGSIVLLLLIWLWNIIITTGLPLYGEILFFLGIIVLIIPVYFLLFFLFRFLCQLSFYKKIRIIVPVSLSLIVILVAWPQDPQQFWRNIVIGFDLFFWVVIVYFLGTAAMVGMSTALYVIKGLTRIPMRLTTFDGFANLRPLRKLQNFSIQILLTLFLTILALVANMLIFFKNPSSNFLVLEDVQWLLDWLRLGIALIFIVIGFGVASKGYFFFTGIYVLLTVVFDPRFPLGVSQFFLSDINVPVIVLGLSFTILIGYQIFQLDGHVSALLQDAKNVELKEIETKLASLKVKLMQLLKDTPMNNQEVQITIHIIDSLLSLKEKLDKVQVNQLRWRRIPELMAPVLTSIVFPLAIEYLREILKPIMFH